MRSTQTSLVKKIASFLTATSIMCSVCGSNFSAFAEYFDNASRYKASIVDDTENGTVEFVANERYEDVYKEVPIENSEVGITVNENGELVQEVIGDSDLTEEITEPITEEPTEEVSTEASTEATEVTEETTVTETTEAIAEEAAEVAEETVATEVSTEDVTTETTVEVTEEITEEVIEEAVEETTEEKIIYTTVVDPRAKNIFSGDVVILNTIPDENYFVESIYVVTDSGKAVPYYFKDNTVSFNMPKSNVTIRATFTADLSEVKIDDSVVDSYTYIKSNLDPNYVTMNKWETVQAIKVKQTVVDKSVLDSYGLDAVISNFRSNANNMFDAFINLQLAYIPVYDVDSNSNYCVAFVNTMQNDNCAVYDYIVAKNNDFGEVLEGNYFDKNTGLLYINKNNIVDISSENISSIDSLCPNQIQLLNVFESADNTEHQVNLIVNDEEEILDIDSGSVTMDQYDQNISLRIAEDSVDANVSVKVNGIEYENLNLSKDTSTDLVNYSSDSKILTINSKSIDTNSIELAVDEESTNNDPIQEALAASLGYSFTGTNFPSWKLMSGTASCGSLDKDTTVRYSGEELGIGKRYKASEPNSYVSYGSGSAMQGLYDSIWGGKATINSPTLSTSTSTMWYTYKASTTPLTKQFKIGSGNWKITHKSNKTNALLICGDIGQTVNVNGTPGDDEMRVSILNIDTTNKKLTWGILVYEGFTQIGVGVFTSDYTIAQGKFSMSKSYNNGDLDLDTALTSAFYDRNGVQYELRRKDTDKLIAIFVGDEARKTEAYYRTTTNRQLHPLLQKGYSQYVIEKKYNTLTLIPGWYTVKETAHGKGFVNGSTGVFEFEIKDGSNIAFGEKAYPKNRVRRNYAVATEFSAKKTDSSNTRNNFAGGEFALYYCNKSDAASRAADCLKKAKVTSNVISEDALLSESKDFKKIATFKSNTDGSLTPEKTGTIFSVYSDPTNKDKMIYFPDVSGKKVTNLPLGYYIFVEEKAPTQFDLDTYKGYPAFYYFNFSSPPSSVNQTSGSVAMCDFDNLTKYKYTYNGAKYVGSTLSTSDSIVDVKNQPKTNFGAKKSIINNTNKVTLSNSNFVTANGNTLNSTNAYMPNEIFISMFADSYSIQGAVYQLLLNNSVIATGLTTSNGYIDWTISDANSGYYTATVGSAEHVCGLKYGSKVTLKELTPSKGTYVVKSSHEYTVNGSLFAPTSGDGSGTSSGNALKLAELSVNKKVKLTENGETITLDFSTATPEQKAKYFAGTSFEVYYKPLNNDNIKFPEIYYGLISGRAVKIDIKPTDMNATRHVATITYEPVLNSNGVITSAKKVVKPIAFAATSKSYSGAYSYIASTSKAADLTKLPLGKYFIYESSVATNSTTMDIRNATGRGFKTIELTSPVSSKTEAIVSEFVTITNTEDIETKPGEFSLKKQLKDPSLSNSQAKATDNTIYYVYYNIGNPLNESSISFDDFADGIYTGNNSNVLLVGQFNTSYDQGYDSDTKTVNSICTNNIFKNKDSNGVSWNHNIGDKEHQDKIDALLANSKDKIVDISSDNFVGKPESSFVGAAGQYLVVEAFAPEGFEIDDTVHLMEIDAGSSASSNIILSEEERKPDPLNIKIVKTNSQGFDELVSLDGTQFTVSYYEGATDFNSLGAPTINLVYEVKTVTGADGQVIKNNIDLKDPTYLVKDKNDFNIINNSYINKEGFIAFQDGLFLISETQPASGYNSNPNNTFKSTIDGINYNLFSTMRIRKYTNANGERKFCVDAINPDNPHILWLFEFDISNMQDFSWAQTIYMENDAGFSFNINKEYLGKPLDEVPSSTKFRLTMFDKNNVKFKTWDFDVTTGQEFDSSQSDAFDDVQGKPFIDGFKYKLEEISDSPFYNKDKEFTYYKGLDVSSMLDSSGDLNTIYNYPQPSIRTIAWNSATSTKAAFYEGTVKLIDTVEISNVARDNAYIIQGIAMDVTDPNNIKPLTVNGQVVRGSAVIYVYDYGNKLTNAHVNVEYTFEGTKADLEGKTINFYEYLTLADISSLKMSVDGKDPLFGDSAYDYAGYVNENKISITELTLDSSFEGIDMKIFNDDNTISNVKKNIWTKQLKNPDATATDAILKAINTGNNQELLNIPGAIYNLNKNDVIRHTEPEDENQNIYFPSIKTHECDVFTKSHVSGLHRIPVFEDIYHEDTLRVMDKFTAKNLIPGEYTVRVCVARYGNTAAEDANLFTGFLSFTHNTTNLDEVTVNVGEIWVPNFEGEKFYITEELYDSNGVLIATHTDRDVESQQGYVAKIGTTASNALMDSKLILDGSNATVKDTVDYKNLVEHNHEYYLYGFLVDISIDPDTGKPVNKIVSKASTSFNNGTNTNGTADVNFKFTAEPGQTLVAYEYLYWDNSGKTTYDSLNVGDTFTNDQDNKFYMDNSDYLLARHYDSTDVGQTVYVPKVGTEVLGDKEILPKSEVTITDQVFYENLLANETYTIYGYFVDKNKKVDDESDDVLVATGRKTMTPTSTSGTATMDFTFDSTKFIDKEIVVYEYIYLGDVTTTFNPVVGQTFDKNAVPESLGENGRMIGRHADSTDKKQTVHVTGVYVDILKTDSEGNVLPGAKFRLTDLDNNKQLGEWTTGTERKSFTLAPGDYMLEELEAPNGKALNTEIRFSVVVENSDIKVYYTGTNIELKSKVGTDGVKHYELDLADPDLTRLPTAGGTGVLPIVGAGLLCIAAGAFVIKRRKSNNNEEI